MTTEIRARVLDVTPEQYHADQFGEPSLSGSIAKRLVCESAAHAFLAHARFGAQESDPTKAQDAGTIVHRLVLGKGADYQVIDHDDFRTKEARAQRDAARANGKVPVKASQLVELEHVADNLRKLLPDYGVNLTGISELPLLWREPVFMADRSVQAKCMMDHCVVNEGLIYELKTCASAHPEAVSKQAYNLGYDISAVAYTRALEALKPELAGRIDFRFVFAEIEPPYCITVFRPDGAFMALGDARWSRAVAMWDQCMRTNKWPGYASETLQLSPPSWAMREAV
jgi:hypothetical protein